MLSAAKIKLIHSLAHKKFRTESGLFLAEGTKLNDDLNGRFECALIAATEEWFESRRGFKAEQSFAVTPDELKKASLLQAPQEVLGLYRIPHNDYEPDVAEKDLCLALDGIQDPGNLGTIVRLADWFGIEHLFCSRNTVDIYNPKSVQATMGAIARVKVHYVNLSDFIGNQPEGVPVYGTFMDGNDIYCDGLSRNGIVIMGNEGSGISDEIGKMVTRRLGIPNYPKGRPTSESLNVAMAASIVCSEFRRRFR